MNDLIRRSDAIDELMHIIPYKRYHNGKYVFLLDKRECLAAIKAISPADRQQGEWIEVDDVSISCRCSVCGWEAHLYEDDVYGMPYCPNCGAHMKGADDENG